MRLLVVEDDILISAVIARAVQAAGHQIVSEARTLEEGLKMVGYCDCEAAILDVDLRGKNSGPIAERLHERGIPFLVVTGRSGNMATAHQRAPLLTKPFQINDLLTMISNLHVNQQRQSVDAVTAEPMGTDQRFPIGCDQPNSMSTEPGANQP